MAAGMAMLVALAAAFSAAATDVPVSCATNAAVRADYVPPTGAGSFTVEPPRKTGGPVVRAADFGFSPTNPACQLAINRAVAHARAVGASRIELAPGVYRCFGSRGVAMEGLKDLTLDGRGATLVFWRPPDGAAGPNVLVKDCERVELGNFTMDWDWENDPLGDFVEVTGRHVGEKEDGSSYFDVKFPGLERHPVHPRPLAVAEFNPMTLTPEGELRFRDAVPNAEGNEMHGDLNSNSLGAKSRWLSPNTLRVWPHVRAERGPRNPTWDRYFSPALNRRAVDRLVRTGATYRMLHYYYGEGGFKMDSNADLTLRGITVWSCRGHGFCVAGDQTRWQMLGVKLTPPAAAPGSRRVVTSTSDGTHVVQSNGFCLYDGCEFRLMNDDTWNFHDVSAPVRRRDARTLACVSPYGTSRMRAKPGDVVELAEADFTPVPWRGRIVSVAADAFTVDADVPEGDAVRLLFDRSRATAHVRIRNCLVEDTHNRGLLYSNDTTVENCVFRRTGSHALSFEVYYNLERSAEGSGVTNVVVRGCTFDETERRSNAGDSPTIRAACCVNPWRLAPKRLHRGVFGRFLVEKCRFVNPRGMCARLDGVSDFMFRDNEIEVAAARGNPRGTQGWMGFRNSEDVRIEGNRWTVSPSMTNVPAVRIEGDCPRFCSRGNVVERRAQGPSRLEDGFRSPPSSAKPHTWYHLMNGNVTKEGITCDFEALAKAGIGGVQMFDAGCGIPAGPLRFNSPEWFDMLKHAASEARRLGLEVCIPNCSGWSSSGGPWNAPSNGMKKVVFTETRLKGPSSFHGVLPREKKDNGYYEDIAVLAYPEPPAEGRPFGNVATACSGGTVTFSSPEPFTLPGFSYRLEFPKVWIVRAKAVVEVSQDGAAFEPADGFEMTVAESGSGDRSMRFRSFPKPVRGRVVRVTFSPLRTPPTAAGALPEITVAEARPESGMRLGDIAAKTFGIRCSAARDTAEAEPGQVVRPDGEIDLSAKMKADGTLDWEVPPGEWIVLRAGAVCNGVCNHPASDHGRGLEADKLSASAIDHHFDRYVARLCRTLGPLAGDVESGLNSILVDSYEVGSQNWTQGLGGIFERRMGYSLRPWLPVFAGRVVGSVDESERFLEDFRRVVADLFAENYAGRLARNCRRYGLKLYLEPYGSCPADNLQYGQDVDVPMCEFWSHAGNGDHATGTGNAALAASIAHVWGRRYVAAESFTGSPNAGGRWLTTPFSIKAQCDCAYAAGVNRIVYHRFVHQPWPGDRRLPGMTLGRWGMHFDRTQTWWPLVGGWLRYQARCQWMLQEGTFVADALFFCGEEAPNQGGNTDGSASAGRIGLPYGYAWDACATRALEMLTVDDGAVVAPGGVRYRLLVLPSCDTMSGRVLGKIGELLDAGAKVCGPVRPTRAPGLGGRVSSYAAIVDSVWGKGVLECSPAEAMERLGVAQDFDCAERDPVKGAHYIHRRGTGTEAADWYFVACNNTEPKTVEASFRIVGRRPEIWDAETGKIADAGTWREENGRTFVTLDFPPSGSAFVVFRRKAENGNVKCRVKNVELRDGDETSHYTFYTLHSPWQVAFPVDWYTGGNAIKTVEMPELADWTSFDDPDIRYFSGTATYKTRIPLPCSLFPVPSSRIILDLGEVRNFAVVTVNGKEFPALWRPPYRVDVTEATGHAGAPGDSGDALDIEMRVTNLWPNRLIGDDFLPPDVEWTGEVRKGVNEIGVKEIPEWVKRGEKSPTGRHTFTTWKHWTKDDAPLPSGLLGPVRILRSALKPMDTREDKP